MTLPLVAATLLLCAALYTDLIYGLIPNRITVGFAAVALLICLWSGVGSLPMGASAADTASVVLSGTFRWALGLATGGLVFLVPYIQKAAGGGDLKLFAALGAITGPLAVCSIFLYATVAWGISGLLVVVKRRVVSNTRYPILKFFRIGSDRTIPFSVPAAAGFLTYVFRGAV